MQGHLAGPRIPGELPRGCLFLHGRRDSAGEAQRWLGTRPGEGVCVDVAFSVDGGGPSAGGGGGERRGGDVVRASWWGTREDCAAASMEGPP